MKKLKSVFLIIASICVCQFTNAQPFKASDIESHESTELKSSYSYVSFTAIGHKDYFYINKVGSSVMLQQFDKQIELLEEIDLASMLPKKSTILGLYSWQKDLVIPYCYNVSSDKTQRTGLLVLSQSDLSEQFNLQHLVSTIFYSGKDNPIVTLTFSADNNTLALVNDSRTKVKKLYKKIVSAVTINTDYEVVSEYAFINPYEKGFELQKSLVSNTGDVYLLMDIRPEYFALDDWKVARLSASSSAMDTTTIDFTDHLITAASFVINDQEETIICSGTSSNDKNINSTFYISLDYKHLEIIEKTKYVLGMDFFTEHLSISDKKSYAKSGATYSGVYGNGTYYMRNLLFHNGDVYGLAELEDASPNHIYLADLFLFKYNENGELEWNQRIIKNQKNADYDVIGVYSAIVKEDFKVWFVEQPQNVIPMKPTNNAKDNHVIEGSVTLSGEVSTRSLGKVTSSNMVPIFRNATHDETQILFFSDVRIKPTSKLWSIQYK